MQTRCGDYRQFGMAKSPDEQVSRKASARRRQRASGLSREKIVRETLAWLRANPAESLTVAKAAASVGATPMAIYRHFEDFSDLADAIVTAVLEGIEDEIERSGDWKAQVEDWMRGLHRRMIETPQCVSLLNTPKGLSAGWMRAAAVLRRCLQRGGIAGTSLSEAVFWITVTLIGFSRQTLTSPLELQIDGTIDTIAKLSDEEKVELAPFAADVPRMYRNGLDILIERTLAGVEALRPR